MTLIILDRSATGVVGAGTLVSADKSTVPGRRVLGLDGPSVLSRGS